VQAVADAPRPKLFYEMDASDQTKPFAAAPNGFYGQLVDLAGAANIYADVPGDFAQVSAESVVAREPDLIVLADPRLADGLETLAYLVHPDRLAASGGPHLSAIDGVRPYCAPGQMPAFSFGFAIVSETLGTSMGEPTECAHAEVASGDTYQRLLMQRSTAPGKE
jgi:ABC-type Fe3+-hydroxamate transport system substrate-binding protein